MYTKLFSFLALTFIFAACGKTNSGQFISSNPCGTLATGLAPAAEIDSVKAYLTAKDITATQDSTGLFYKIDTAGSGAVPTACSAITVKYTGSLTNGGVFDSSGAHSSTGLTFYLAQVIVGWQIGLPHLQSGGTMTLYIPPSLGYGATNQAAQAGFAAIPANSILIFKVNLLGVQQ